MVVTSQILSEQTPDVNYIVKELHFIHDINNVRWDSFQFLIGIDSLKGTTSNDLGVGPEEIEKK